MPLGNVSMFSHFDDLVSISMAQIPRQDGGLMLLEILGMFFYLDVPVLSSWCYFFLALHGFAGNVECAF